MKDVTIIETASVTKIINLNVLNQFLIDSSIYKMPSFLDQEVTDRALVEKYQKRLEYTGNFRDGYIYQHAVAAARLLEQQQKLFDAVSINDKPLSEKQKSFLENVFQKNKPCFLRSEAAGDQGTSLTFFPIYQFLGQEKETGLFVAQFGYNKKEFSSELLAELEENSEQPWPYVIYKTPSLRTSIKYAYILAQDFQRREEAFLSELLTTYDDKIKPGFRHFIQALQLKKEGEINLIGMDFVTIKHIDPHEGFIFTAERAFVTDENEVAQYVRFSIPFQSKKNALDPEYSVYKKAVIYGEVLTKLLRLKTTAVLSKNPITLENQVANLLNLRKKHYWFGGGLLGKKELSESKVIEFESQTEQGQEVFSVLVPEEFFQKPKMAAYLFKGTLKKALQGQVYQVKGTEKELLTIETLATLNPNQGEEPKILGGAVFYPENQMIHFVDNFKTPLAQVWVSEAESSEDNQEWLLGMLLKFIINQ